MADCQNLVTQAQLSEQIEQLLRQIEDSYLKKSELVTEIDQKKDPILTALMKAETWEEITVTINLADYIKVA